MNISTFQSNLDFIKSLYFREEWKDKDCRDAILEALEEANEKIEKAFGDSLHRLDEHKPTVEAVRKVVNKFPSTLVYEDGDGCLPIQSAAGGDASEYVPILEKEGVKHKVGGEDARGGLLLVDPSDDDGWNTLQWLVNVGDDDEDVTQLNALKELRKMDLLVKRDIKEQELLLTSCWKESEKRFEYLVSLDPDALIETRFHNKPLIHYIASQSDEQRIILLLKAAFKHHPNRGGLLFDKDDQGTTALDCLYNEKGIEKIMSLLYDILSPKRDYPILHHVFLKAPQHINIFMRKLPWAFYLKDHNGRTVHQAVLAAGPDIMRKNDILLSSLTDNQIQTKDPITTLYPFAAMAVGEHADLENTFYLLRRQPSVMDRHSRSEIDTSSNRRKRRRIQKQQVK
ncbi:hypothetical protein CTEN210_00547 [Chaetoceros tenuissimus]|uniref:Ankyrin repeat-containing protein n=1 Tax=Chaetoceros tenuissimus TaxID=426638 RepID=A0AAD3GZ20_9STRA|nr:hypothetical protein CTEN210_00547 [Chaetoceros tenuissimus]